MGETGDVKIAFWRSASRLEHFSSRCSAGVPPAQRAAKMAAFAFSRLALTGKMRYAGRYPCIACPSRKDETSLPHLREFKPADAFPSSKHARCARRRDHSSNHPPNWTASIPSSRSRWSIRNNPVSIDKRILQIGKTPWRATLDCCRVTVYEFLDGTRSVGYGPQIIGRYRVESVLLRWRPSRRPAPHRRKPLALTPFAIRAPSVSAKQKQNRTFSLAKNRKRFVR